MFYFVLSFLAGILSVLFLNDKQILILLIVLGQAHFLIVYFYLNKHNKINQEIKKKFLLTFSIVTVVSTYVYYNTTYLPYLAFFTGLLFVIHYYNDEIKVNEIKRLVFLNLGTLSVFLSFTSVYLYKIFKTEVIYSYVLAFFSIFFLILFLFFLVKERSKIKKNKIIFLSIFTTLNVVTPIYLIVLQKISSVQIFGFIIFFHYMRWYFYYFDKFKVEQVALKSYLKIVFSVHLLLLALMIQHVLTKNNSYMLYFFHPAFFYGWTILHIVLSMRKSDFSKYE